jgi:ubiquinone/menaquinone biosynthesis C-methylase UbiE
MQNSEAYDQWSVTYDSVVNKTRDLEAKTCRELLSQIEFSDVIELGCGTGKNTEWLVQKADHVIAVDFSEEMLNTAKGKIVNKNVEFKPADIAKAWNFNGRMVDLITASLVLEHIENIDFVFQQAAEHLKNHGFFYVGELHPFKQYAGSRARFETGSGIYELECFTHHVSEYMSAASRNQFSCLTLAERFDDDNKDVPPRIIAFLFRKLNEALFPSNR